MNIKVTQEINESYFRESFSEWLLYRSKYRKWEPKIGLIAIGLAFLLYLLYPYLFLLSIVLFAFGLHSIIGFYYSKRKWLNDRFNSRINNSSVTMIFEEDKIHSNGPFTITKSNWDFITDAVETEKGLFLIPENGISIYLQKESFENDSQLKQIANKIKANKR